MFFLLLLQLFDCEHVLNTVELLDDVLVHLLLVRAHGDDGAVVVLVVLARDAVYFDPAELYALSRMARRMFSMTSAWAYST